MNSDQTGFMKGRFIGENIRLIDGVINFAEAGNIPGLLPFLDFEKAFDTVEWVFIKKTFQQFTFGPSMIKWINICYNNIESCVLNNGWSTVFFTGAQPKAGTGHKMQTVSVVFSTLHCEGYTADLRYIAGSLLFWSLKSYPPF